MAEDSGEPPLLDDAHAAFLERGVVIAVASRNAGNVASTAHGYGCRVSPDRRRVTIFVAADAARALLDDIGATRSIAVVFSQPSTHRTIQLKGSDAAIVALAGGDGEAMSAHLEFMIAEMALIGFSEAHARAAWSIAPADAAAIAFTPAAAFVQTPGPRAGAPLGS
jgi:D-serine deaminase-like pyridoxal phosphate-dependent protein